MVYKKLYKIITTKRCIYYIVRVMRAKDNLNKKENDTF